MADTKIHQVNVRLTAADWQMMLEAGFKVWPGLEIPLATIVRTLAMQRAVEILNPPKK